MNHISSLGAKRKGGKKQTMAEGGDGRRVSPTVAKPLAPLKWVFPPSLLLSLSFTSFLCLLAFFCSA